MNDSTSTIATAGGRSGGRIKVWDRAVRIFHWSLVAGFAVAWLSAETLAPGSEIHEIAGYVVAALVVFRLVWGLIGGRYARFAQFVRGPAVTLSYMRDMLARRERRYLGHNPAGAAMIVALLVMLAGTALTGWLTEQSAEMAMTPDMPAATTPAEVGEEGEEEGGERGGGESAVAEIHEVLGNLTLLLVLLHVGGVVLASIRHRENLAQAMVTGEKRAPGPDDVA